ncbi:MAG TPA: MBOAT family protein [Candidatus Angelobacter sp.]|nr:MBOAT family protein [Candidatus Angelobacter sp.]
MKKRQCADWPGDGMEPLARAGIRGTFQARQRPRNGGAVTAWAGQNMRQADDTPPGPRAPWLGWLPLLALPLSALAARDHLPAWAFMWTLALSIYAACKWRTWWAARAAVPHSAGRSLAYLAAWPGMDAAAFLQDGRLQNDRRAGTPRPADWLWAAAKTTLGGMLLWMAARALPADLPLLRGWTGMLGAILLLHFGAFHLAALLWQSFGIAARPLLMNSPLASRSLSEFWGKRWNTGFHQLAHDLVFRPLRRKTGVAAAGSLVFLVSGLLHDLVISLPARGGYGLPTLYFALQGAGVALERSRLGRQLGLRAGFRGWLWMAVVTAAPAFWLFHRPFVCRVILPFMEAIHAL